MIQGPNTININRPRDYRCVFMHPSIYLQSATKPIHHKHQQLFIQHTQPHSSRVCITSASYNPWQYTVRRRRWTGCSFQMMTPMTFGIHHQKDEATSQLTIQSQRSAALHPRPGPLMMRARFLIARKRVKPHCNMSYRRSGISIR